MYIIYTTYPSYLNSQHFSSQNSEFEKSQLTNFFPKKEIWCCQFMSVENNFVFLLDYSIRVLIDRKKQLANSRHSIK